MAESPAQCARMATTAVRLATAAATAASVVRVAALNGSVSQLLSSHSSTAKTPQSSLIYPVTETTLELTINAPPWVLFHSYAEHELEKALQEGGCSGILDSTPIQSKGTCLGNLP